VIVVVPAGSSPSGLGLALHEVELSNGKLEWQLQPLSECCGDFFENHGSASPWDESISAFCVGCGKDWTKQMFESSSTYYTSFDLDWVVTTGSRWLSGILGVDEAKLKVTVE
jgi:hypothetical protein